MGASGNRARDDTAGAESTSGKSPGDEGPHGEGPGGEGTGGAGTGRKSAGGKRAGGKGAGGGKSAAIELQAAGRTIRLSSPDRIFFPERGFTKLDVAQYYLSVGDGILRALRDRPTTLERYPEGLTGESFFQKRAPKNLPDWTPTAHITFPSGRFADEMCPTEVGAVIWAAQFGTLTFHPWPVRRPDTEHPDELRLDLDPQPGTDYADAVRAAHELRMVLEENGLHGWPKTSGGRGLHVFVPIEPRWTFTQVRRAAIACGRELERRMPGRVTTAWWKEERGARIFLDYNQTARDRTIASAYSVRPRPRATVSAPLRWDELDSALPADFDLATMPRRYADLGDVHAGMDDERYVLDGLLELARRDERDHGLGDLPYPPEYPKVRGEPKRVQPSRARRAD
ncbi:non-homologous end-joining DNA ligase [Streptomyces odontomachi]|uniref:non-homologous end-joining DNA ligase n=1 Tax=Streptomyces odontomachi TaxID=2944940 RepID=UPI00210B6B17|nr:non-homologous end-joining DNA ligase [Streptomyces sp. ODS25]